ncbi:MAG: hypothetical protein MI975_04890 [Cytophagales bacterium]|nr:hypothetical protein [Cytophagales bacterium]
MKMSGANAFISFGDVSGAAKIGTTDNGYNLSIHGRTNRGIRFFAGQSEIASFVSADGVNGTLSFKMNSNIIDVSGIRVRAHTPLNVTVDGNNGGMKIYPYRDGGAGKAILTVQDNGPGGGLINIAEFKTGISNITSDVIQLNGKVGIGTGSLGPHELAVDGSIGAREIKVEAGSWSDFVFDKDYELQPLEELENYISERKCLPGMPSEAEILENGINLGMMDAKLLEKIEELTLHLIKQNKVINDLVSKSIQQEREIKKLKKSLIKHQTL